MFGFETSRCSEIPTRPTLAQPTPQASSPNRRIFFLAVPIVANQAPLLNLFLHPTKTR